MCETYGVWERRAPLSPAHVAALVSQGYPVVVQPSSRRVFADAHYAAAGATVSNDLSAATVVLGVKQVAVQSLLPGKAYFFFSHTIKAQPENMALLDACVARNVTLFDYECIADNGRRLVRAAKGATQHTSRRNAASFTGFAKTM
jgi:alpha-aminoadipic semialdehyde synthase